MIPTSTASPAVLQGHLAAVPLESTRSSPKFVAHSSVVQTFVQPQHTALDESLSS